MAELLTQQEPQIKFFHLRSQDEYSNIENRGGLTIAWFITEQGDINFGLSQCSHLDNFDKAIGRDIAIERLQADPIVIDNDELLFIIGSLEIAGISKSAANKIRSTLTINDMSLNFIREVILDTVCSL